MNLSDCPIPRPAPAPQGSTVIDRYLQNGDTSNHTFGENCLTVNVWTKPQSGESQKAVLVWIYGGSTLSYAFKIDKEYKLTHDTLGFTSGTSNIPWYNGAHFADTQDVVVVSLKSDDFVFNYEAC